MHSGSRTGAFVARIYKIEILRCVDVGRECVAIQHLATRDQQMPRSVTPCAEPNEVSLGIVAQFAARCVMVNLKIVCRSAVPAAPSLALEHLATELSIRFRLKP